MNAPTQALNLNAAHDPIPFKLMARVLIDRGVPVIPLRPATKIAFQKDWQDLASTDPKQIAEWGEQYPEANVACVAKAALGGFWFFEVDEPNYHKVIQEETGKKIPNTFMVSSRKGQGRGHFYFKQSAASIAMGNLQGRIGGKEAWSARVDDRYVVGPGSIHPQTQEPYTIALDAPIVEAPDWLIEWCVKHNSSESVRVNASPDGLSIHTAHTTLNCSASLACCERGDGLRPNPRQPSYGVREALRESRHRLCRDVREQSEVGLQISRGFSDPERQGWFNSGSHDDFVG